MEGDTLIDTHKDYIVAPRKVAAETGCMFIDANIVTHDYIQSLGPVKSKELFCWLPKGKYKTAPDGRQDDTHLNIKGGNIIAGLLAKEMTKQDAPFVSAELYKLNSKSDRDKDGIACER